MSQLRTSVINKMHLCTTLLTILTLLLATTFSSPTTTLNITHLLTRDSPNAHPFCVPPQGFTLSYQKCTFASAILSESLNPSGHGTLGNAWIFDSLCNVLGVSQNIQIANLNGGIYNFDSQLQYVTVTDFGDGRLGSGPPKVTYGGKTWQPRVGDACWWMIQDDVGSIWGCDFVFDCF